MPGEAIVRVRRSGICGTDWHAYRGDQPFFSYPRILGHELGVEIEQVNDDRSDLKPGDKCSVEPYLNCGTCLPCRRRAEQLLREPASAGRAHRRRDAIANHRARAELHKSAKLSLDQLALVETLGIGCHAVGRADRTR